MLHIHRPITAIVGDDEEVRLADPLAHAISRKPSADDHRDPAFHGVRRRDLQLLLRFRCRDDNLSRNLFEVVDGRYLEPSALIETPLQLRRRLEGARKDGECRSVHGRDTAWRRIPLVAEPPIGRISSSPTPSGPAANTCEGGG